MSKLRVLNFQYNLSKKLSAKPVRWQTVTDWHVSDRKRPFHPDRNEMRQVFDKIDSNKDGKISSEELKWLLEVLGKENPAAEARQMMQVADLNMDGFIDFHEFMVAHQRGLRVSDIQSAFWMFDQDGDGRISAEEVRAMLQRLGEACSLEECRRMVRQVDRNGDGLVDMDEFMAMMTSTMKQA